MSTGDLRRSEDIFGVFVYSHIYSLTSVKMERESFVFYRSFYDAILDLDDKQTRDLLIAVCERALNWNDIELTDKMSRMAMNLIRPQLDANTKRYTDWCGWWRPKKTWDNSQKPLVSEKITTGYENWKPNVNDNVNVNVNENEKGCGEKREANNTLDANASRWIVGEKRVVGKTLSMKLGELWLEPELIELAETYDKCKKGKKLSKFQDEQLKIRVNKLRKCWFNTIEWMKEVLENSIAGWYEWIFELKQNPVPTKPRVSWNLFH